MARMILVYQQAILAHKPGQGRISNIALVLLRQDLMGALNIPVGVLQDFPQQIRINRFGIFTQAGFICFPGENGPDALGIDPHDPCDLFLPFTLTKKGTDNVSILRRDHAALLKKSPAMRSAQRCRRSLNGLFLKMPHL